LLLTFVSTCYRGSVQFIDLIVVVISRTIYRRVQRRGVVPIVWNSIPPPWVNVLGAQSCKTVVAFRGHSPDFVCVCVRVRVCLRVRLFPASAADRTSDRLKGWK